MLIIPSIYINAMEGISHATPVEIGFRDRNFYYTDTKDSRRSTSYGYITNIGSYPIVYRITIEKVMDITISHCSSPLDDTFIRIQDSGHRDLYTSGTSALDKCSNKKQAFLEVKNIQPGTYFIISQGGTRDSNGNITTIIQGNVKALCEYNLGDIKKSSYFTFTDDTRYSFNQWIFKPTNDVFYKFRIASKPMKVKIKSAMAQFGACSSLVNAGAAIKFDCFPADQPDKYLEIDMLVPGNYYIVSEGMEQDGYLTTWIEITDLLEFNIGDKDSSFEYTHTQDTNEKLSGPTDGISYRVNIEKKMDLKIANSAEFSAGSYISVLNSEKTSVIGTKLFPQNNPSNEFLSINNLEPGVYYIVSKGNNQEGVIKTNIAGYTLAEYDLGTINSTFDHSHTQDTHKSRNEYNIKSTNEAVYKINISNSAMNLRISNSMSHSSGSHISLLTQDKLSIVGRKSFYKNNPTNDYLQVNNISPGIYYIVSEGETENGFIDTYINIFNGSDINNNKNYIKTRTYTDSGNRAYFDAIQYFDGLGCPVQNIQQGFTPDGNDLVSYQEYDNYGRESTAWLSTSVMYNNGNFVPLSRINTNAIIEYFDQKPYSKPVYESSPLNRVMAQYGPGQDWHNNGKAVKYLYGTNTGGSPAASQVTLGEDPDGENSGVISACDRIILSPGFHFQSTTERSLSLHIDPSQCVQPTTLSAMSAQQEQIDPAHLTCTYYSVGVNKLIKSGSYQADQLYVTQISDEDGNKSLEFKDKLGQVILTRQINGSEKYDTYFVYDDFGNLRYVLPPIAVERATDLSDNSEVMKQYAYVYQYDHRNRCIWKRLPGCDPIYYVYDKADRLIFSQDGEQRVKSPKQWTFNKYDAFGRLVVSGIYRSSVTQEQLANSYKDIIVKEETGKGGNYGYTWNTLADVAVNDVLLINYYDNYETMLKTNSYYKTNLDYKKEEGYGDRHPNAKGLLVGTRIKSINPDGTSANTITGQTVTAMYYDIRGRIIQTKSTNHLNGIETEYIAYNFTGQPVKRLHVHTLANGTGRQEELYTFTYDHAGRLLDTKHKLNDNAETILTENAYDELGRLKTNKKGGKEDLKSTYTYNVRSWIRSISGPLFSQTLSYNESGTGNTPQYSGNISAMAWNTDNQPERTYNFTYDGLSRLTSAVYNKVANGGYYNTAYNYDKHGNIHTLQRYGKKDAGNAASSYGLVDNLTMVYAGNQLVKATDTGVNVNISSSGDFKDRSNTAVEYTYNRNGAMTKDLNKGITEIKYNSLNLPAQIHVSNNQTQGWNKYHYSASGVKLRVESQKSIDMLAAPMAGTLSNTYATTQNKITDYVGNIIYENNTLKRILVDGGYIENRQYHFYLSDHLGNNRLVYNAGADTIVQKNHYYPFGMSFADSSNPEAQPYKYNGKELDGLHGLDMYDYSARHYMPDIPRFTTIDPHAESYYSISPYVYVLNNPIRAIDPNGKDVYMLFYTTDDARYKSAAETRKKEIEGMEGFNAEKDHVYIQELGDLGTLGDRVNDIVKDAIDKGYGLTMEASFWSHGGYDGPRSDTRTSGEFALDNNLGRNQLSPEGWSNINWNFDSQNSMASFYGCNTASFARDFFDYSNVAYTAGQGGQAGPSYETGKFDKVNYVRSFISTSSNVYYGTIANGEFIGPTVYSRKYDREDGTIIKGNASVIKNNIQHIYDVK